MKQICLWLTMAMLILAACGGRVSEQGSATVVEESPVENNAESATAAEESQSNEATVEEVAVEEAQNEDVAVDNAVDTLKKRPLKKRPQQKKPLPIPLLISGQHPSSHRI